MSQNEEQILGQRLSFDGALCTVRYIGQVNSTTGTWLGVEWDDPSRGKHDGAHKGTRYFECLSRSPTAASFVRPTRRAETPMVFVEALRTKYASEVTVDLQPISSGPQIVISGKVAEEVGFDKIRKQQAQLSELKIVILDGMRIDAATAAGGQEKKLIREVCPKVTELDLSRNLFTRLDTVAEICSQLKLLRALKLNGNRFQQSLSPDSSLETCRHRGAFERIKELAVDETLLSCDELWRLATCFPSLGTLFASSNQLARLSPLTGRSGLMATLTAVHLEYNDFASLSDIACLTALTSLRSLHLKGNNISAIISDSPAGPPVFSNTLTYLDLSYNRIHTWCFIDALPDSFPGLNSLRLSHNPVYDNPNPAAVTVTDEAYMLVIGRLAGLRSLNFSTITSTDRTNAEMFYLSRIGRQLSSVPDTSDAEAKVRAQHRRYTHLCEAYGEPVVVRRREANPAFLEARLIRVTFRSAKGVEKQAQLPRGFDVYAVKGIAGKLFGYSPLELRLVWETGEWDPVAVFDEEDEDSSGDEEAEVEAEETIKENHRKSEKKNVGRWIKREVELSDSPRQFGFCVDGQGVMVRVERL